MIEIGDIYSLISTRFVIQVFKIDLFYGELAYCKVLEVLPSLADSFPIGSTYILNVTHIYCYKKL